MSNVSIKGIDKNVYENTYDSFFLGQWYTFDFEQPFKHNFIASTKSLAFNLKCFKNGRFKTDNIEFDNMFYVCSLQNNEYFDVPNSHFLTKLRNIKNTLKCEILFVFDGNRLHIGVCSRMRFFETRKFMRLNIKREFEDLSKELETLTYLIDEFSKDELLFK